jgi:hypothetical protein
MRHNLFLGMTVLVLGVCGSAMAGVVVTATHTRLDTRQPGTATTYVEADRLKMVNPDMTMIFRGDINRVWTIDTQKRSYVEMTPETMQQLGGQMANLSAQMSAAQAQMQAQLAQMPPEQRAMMEQMLAGRGLSGAPGGRAGGPPAPPQSVYTKTGQSKTLANARCDVYRWTISGNPEQELCLAPIASVGLSAADFQVLERFSKFMEPILSSPMIPRNSFISWNEMNKAIGFQGVPLETTTFVGTSPSQQQTVTKIERMAIPANTFDLPAGLTKQEIPGPPSR